MANWRASTVLAATGGTINGAAVTGFAPAAQSLATALPNLMKAIRTNTDDSPATLRVIGLGSSVGAGATLPDAATQAPSAYFHTQLAAHINRLGNLTLAHTNGSVGGSTVSAGNSTDYALAKTAAGGVPKVATLAYGMNDGTPGQYHLSQTYPGMYTALVTMIRSIQGDNGDPVLFTTPHPHSTRYPWTDAIGTVTYPVSGVANPALTAVASVVSADWSGGGTNVPASFRHKRINDTIRQVGLDMGVPVIDVERYWFRAVALYGENLLYDTNEYVHPNLLGHQQSYHAAIDDFIDSLALPSVVMGIGGLNQEVVAYKVSSADRTSVTLSDDTQLQFYAGASQVWEVEMDVFFTAPTGGDLKVGFSVPSGADGKLSVIGPAYDATTYDTGPGIFRSTVLNGGNLPVGGNGADSYAKVKAIVRTSTTAGNVTAQWAQVAASGTTTVYLDTFLRARRIA